MKDTSPKKESKLLSIDNVNKVEAGLPKRIVIATTIMLPATAKQLRPWYLFIFRGSAHVGGNINIKFRIYIYMYNYVEKHRVEEERWKVWLIILLIFFNKNIHESKKIKKKNKINEYKKFHK